MLTDKNILKTFSMCDQVNFQKDITCVTPTNVDQRAHFSTLSLGLSGSLKTKSLC